MKVTTFQTIRYTCHDHSLNGKLMSMDSIRIEKLTTANFEPVFEFMKTNFAPDEPLFKSTEACEGDGFTEKMMMAELKEKFVRKPIESQDSFGAFDSEGNIVGVRMGFISDKKSLPGEPGIAWMLKLPSCMFSQKFIKCMHIDKFTKETNYSFAKAFDQCEDHNGKIYFGMAVSVKRDVRVKGLGTRLVKKSIDYAKELGCSHMYTLVTGIYSQKIVKNLGFRVLYEKDYDSYKDKYGKVVIDDDVHKSAQVVALKMQ